VSDYTFQDSVAALEQDLTLVAAARGVSLDEARERYATSQTLDDVASQAASKWPAQFVGSSLSPAEGPTLYVKGVPNPALLVLALEEGVRVVSDQPYSFNELEARKSRVHRALEALGYQYVTTSFDIADGRWVEAHVAGDPQLSEADILAGIPEDLRSDVRLSVGEDTTGYRDLEAFGGMALRADGSRVCTSGWSVKHQDLGITGVTGAGHCTGVDEVYHPGHGLHALTWRAQHRGEYGDIEWYTSGVNDPDDFYADEGLIRDVSGVEQRSEISVDEPVCFFGRTSDDRDCSLEVHKTSVACTNDGVFNDRLVMMNGRGVAELGDSGGGFSFGNTAYGSVKGWCEPEEWLTFSVASLYDQALNISVRW